MPSCNLTRHGWSLGIVVGGSLLATQLFAFLGIESMVYGLAVIVGSIYVLRYPGEGIWVLFFLLAITCLLYPISVSELGEPGIGEFRPYNIVIASMAGAMALSPGRRQQHFLTTSVQNRSAVVRWILTLAAVFGLATIYGDLSPLRSETVYILQQSSAWVSFFLFLWIGYKLALSHAELQQSVTRFHSVALAYSLVFIGKFIYLDQKAGLLAATDFAWAQRIALFFAACSLVLIFAKRLAPEGGSPTTTDWLSALIIVPAVVLSGSRGVAGAAVLSILVLAASWRIRVLLRLSPLILLALLGFTIALSSHSQVVEEYVVSKFFITPDLDPSFAGRVAEMGAVIEAIQRNPVLGSGTLASYAFFDPLFGWRESAFVDNGVGYLLLKTGLLGTGTFVVLILSYLKMFRRLRNCVAEDALIPFVIFVFYLAFMAFGPSFFDLRYCWLVGILCGYSLYLNNTCIKKLSLSTAELQGRWKLKPS